MISLLTQVILRNTASAEGPQVGYPLTQSIVDSDNRLIRDDIALPKRLNFQTAESLAGENSIPTYKPSGHVTLVWTMFGLQTLSTLYIASRGIAFPKSARTFHILFGMVGTCASIAYLLEAGALEYIELSNESGESGDCIMGNVQMRIPSWRLPCYQSNFSDTSIFAPLCAVVPYYVSRVIVQSLMIWGIAFLAGTPKSEQLAASTCVALMECSNCIATLLTSLYEVITIYSILFFALRLLMSVPLIYFLLHGVEHNIRRAPKQVRAVCHGWGFITVLLQFWNMSLWCVAYFTTWLSFFTLLMCRVLGDAIITIIIPLLVLKDHQLIRLLKERDERVLEISKAKTEKRQNFPNPMMFSPQLITGPMKSDFIDTSGAPMKINYLDRVYMGAEGEERYDDYGADESYGYEEGLHVAASMHAIPRSVKGATESDDTAVSLSLDMIKK